MSVMKDFFELAGISAPNAVAGFSGGLVHIFWYKKTSPFDAAGALVGGTLTAIYIGEPLAAKAGLPPGLVCFFLGLGGMQALAPTFSWLREKILGPRGLAAGGGEPNA